MTTKFLSTGYASLDRVLGGGWPIGGSVLVKGASGSGKSRFVRASLQPDVDTLYVAFEDALFSVVESLRRLCPAVHADMTVLGRCRVRDQCKMGDWHRKPKLAVFDGVPHSFSSRANVNRWLCQEVERARLRRHALVWIAPTLKTTGRTIGGPAAEHEVDTVVYVEKAKSGLSFSVQTTKNRHAPRLDTAVFGFSREGRPVALSDVSMASAYERRVL